MSRQKRCRRRLLLLLLLLLTVGNVVLLQLRIAPMLRKIAENQVVNAASEAIFRAVTRQLQTGSVDYSRIIGLEKDASGKVSALTTDMEQIARLKSEMLTLLDEELAKMNSKHKAELEAIREEERKNFQEELNAKDKEIEESAKRFSKAVEEHRKEMASTRKDLLKEQSKNSEVATLGKATYAMEQLLKSYEQVMGIIESVGKFDRVTAKKMMTEVNKSMHAVETKVRKKLTA